MKRGSHSLRRGVRGFSLVELMVAMGLSLVLLAGALSILYSSKVTYTENDRIARLQEAGRTAMELISRDVRAAGFNGCAKSQREDSFYNGLDDSSSLQWNMAKPLDGFDTNPGNTNWNPALPGIIDDATAGSDVLVVRTTRQGQPVFRTTDLVTGAAAIPVLREPNTSVPPGTVMVISDCQYTNAFVASAFSPLSATTATISHAMGGTPGNADGNLKSSFKIDSFVTPMETVMYYVCDSESGNGPALCQRIGNAMEGEELIQGVENIQLRYGVDTNADRLVDSYVNASAAVNWDNVISLSISMLVRSEVETGLDVDRQSYTLLDVTLPAANDRRQRSVFTTTIALRNRTT